MKSLFFSALFSLVLFFVLVVLGIQYHWVDLYYHKTPAELKLALPEPAESLDNDPRIVDETITIDDSAFEAAIMEQESAVNPFASMTRQQVAQFCNERYKNSAQQQKIVLVADCVMKNYQEDFQEIGSGNSAFRNAALNSAANPAVSRTNPSNSASLPGNSAGRQQQTRVQAIRNRCASEINRQNGLSAHEKQLLIETCVSDLSN